MPKFIILVGTIKTSAAVQRDGKTIHIGKMHATGSEIELSAEEAERINKKGDILEPLELHEAKKKARSDAKSAIEKAEADAKAKLKGGGK